MGRLIERMLADYLHADRVRASIGSKGVELGITSGRTKRDWIKAGRTPVAIELSEAVMAGYDSTHSAWEWVPASENFRLPAGKHRLIVHNKDDGVKLDCMVLYREGESR